MLFPDGTSLTLAPGSDVTVEEFEFTDAGAGRLVLRVERGLVRVAGGAINERTPIVVRTSAGEVWLDAASAVVEVGPDGATGTNLLAGRSVRLQSGGQTQSVEKPGFQMVSLGASTAPQEPARQSGDVIASDAFGLATGQLSGLTRQQEEEQLERVGLTELAAAGASALALATETRPAGEVNQPAQTGGGTGGGGTTAGFFEIGDTNGAAGGDGFGAGGGTLDVQNVNQFQPTENNGDQRSVVQDRGNARVEKSGVVEPVRGRGPTSNRLFFSSDPYSQTLSGGAPRVVEDRFLNTGKSPLDKPEPLLQYVLRKDSSKSGPGLELDGVNQHGGLGQVLDLGGTYGTNAPFLYNDVIAWPASGAIVRLNAKDGNDLANPDQIGAGNGTLFKGASHWDILQAGFTFETRRRVPIRNDDDPDVITVQRAADNFLLVEVRPAKLNGAGQPELDPNRSERFLFATGNVDAGRMLVDAYQNPIDKNPNFRNTFAVDRFLLSAGLQDFEQKDQGRTVGSSTRPFLRDPTALGLTLTDSGMFVINTGSQVDGVQNGLLHADFGMQGTGADQRSTLSVTIGGVKYECFNCVASNANQLVNSYVATATGRTIGSSRGSGQSVSIASPLISTAFGGGNPRIARDGYAGYFVLENYVPANVADVDQNLRTLAQGGTEHALGSSIGNDMKYATLRLATGTGEESVGLRSDRFLTGWAGGLAEKENGPGAALTIKPVGTGDTPNNFIIRTDAANNRIQADLNLNSAPITLGGPNNPSALIDDDRFAAANGSVAIVNANVLRDAAGNLPAALNMPNGQRIPKYEYLQWGLLFGDTAGTPGADLQHLHMGTWIAGRTADPDHIPSTGSASYSGHAIGNVASGGALYTAVGIYDNTWNFAQRAGTVNMNFDGAQYSGTTQLTNGANFQGTVAATSRAGGVIGNFVQVLGGGSAGVAPPAVAGRFVIQGTPARRPTEHGAHSAHSGSVDARMRRSGVQPHLESWRLVRAMHIVIASMCIGVAAAQTSAPGAASASASRTGAQQALDFAKSARALAASHQYAQAIPLGERALAMARVQYGPRHEYVAYILDDLATWNYQLQHFEEAMQYSLQAVGIIGDAKGVTSIEYASLVNNLASIRSVKGQYQEAATLYEGSYATIVKNLGPDHERSAQLARNLGIAYLELSRYDAAQRHFAEALRASRARQGDASLATARAYLDLSGAHLRMEQVDEARREALAARDILAPQRPSDAVALSAADVMLAQIDIHESRLDSAKTRLDAAQRTLDAAHASDALARASVLYNIGWIELLRRQSVEAERVYQEVLAIYQRMLSPQHPSIGRALHCLAIVYQDLGQFDESERFYQRAIAIFTASFGPDDASVAATRLEYSSLLSERGRSGDAIREARAAIAIYDVLPGPWDIKRGYANSGLALAQHRAGDLDAAARTYAVSRALITKARGAESSDLPPGLTDLARIHRAQGRFDDAGRELDQAIRIRRKDGAATPSALAESLAELANLRLAQGRAADALAISREAVTIAQARLDLAQRSLSSSALGEQRQARALFEQFLELGAANHASTDDALLREMFEVAQLPHLSGTSGAISQMAVRFSAGEGPLAALVRERQDTVERWRALDRTIIEGLTQTQAASTDAGKLQANRETLAELAKSIDRLDGTLRRDFPQFAELTNPRPVAASTVQHLLASHEAMLLQVTSAQATYLFFVTAHSLKFARTALDSKQLEQTVNSIRQGLDFRNARSLSELPPFDVAAAYLLYQRLLQPFAADLTDARHIVAIVDRAMQSLPLSVLLATPVDAPPRRAADYGKLDFLSRHYAFSVEPSVSSFAVLRSVARRSNAPRPFVGFGDPQLLGSGTATRGQLNDRLVMGVDPALLRTALVPLPETRSELTAVARALQASDSDLYFGARATKPMVMQMNLASYRILAFATHGLLAGEFRGIAEPALVLTPPSTISPSDNGLLTASEIATLKLDADWVLLSACNTAAPEGRAGAEGLSGLAKAFFYAGSRALLVSHWSVASESTAALMSTATRTLAEEPDIGRAEALRRAMLALLDGKDQPAFAHPIFWGPFVNVGEGMGRMGAP